MQMPHTHQGSQIKKNTLEKKPKKTMNCNHLYIYIYIYIYILLLLLRP